VELSLKTAKMGSDWDMFQDPLIFQLEHNREKIWTRKHSRGTAVRESFEISGRYRFAEWRTLKNTFIKRTCVKMKPPPA
jgi:hypothetical protein